MNRYLRLLPSLVTFCAALLGAFSIVHSTRGACQAAAILILCASVLDVLDGWVARLVNGATRLGTVLDSVSDFVAFCIAPAVLLYAWRLFEFGAVGAVACGFLALCGGLRLARFVRQADAAEETTFTGLPTPAAAVIVASGVWTCTEHSAPIPGAALLAVCLAFLLGVLMVSKVPYRSAKGLLSSGGMEGLLAILAGAILLFAIRGNVAIALFAMAMGYVLWGVIESWVGPAGTQRDTTGGLS